MLENLKDFGAQFMALNEAYPIMSVVYIIVFTFVTASISNFILLKLQNKTRKKSQSIYHSMLKYLRRPVRLLIWLLGLTFALESLVPESEALLETASGIRVIGVVLILTLFVMRLIRVYEKHLYKRAKSDDSKLDRMTADTISKLLKITVIIVSIMVLMQSLGLHIGGLLALGGASGIGISLAAKDLLSNFFGAIMIYMDKPFKVGDCIQSPDRQIAGTVEEIGWRLTKIRTFEKMLLFVPNSAFNIISVESYTKMSHRRIKEFLKIRYCDIKSVNKITKDIKDHLKARNDIDTSQTTMVNIEEFGEFGIDIMIYCFTVTRKWDEYYEVKQDVLCEIEKIIESHGAQIALPRGDLQPAASGAK